MTTHRKRLASVGLALVATAQFAWSAAIEKRIPETVSKLKGEASELVNQWYTAGTAAGNRDDYYDNRDRGHSMLNVNLFPQVQTITYSDEEKQRRADWGAAGQVRNAVVIGNSSTSAKPTEGGSNPRALYLSARTLVLLYLQYRAGNLYVYPEHRDYDPGRNGRGGYGDLYPINTPYLMISQGSSGSDKKFLEACFLTLAAFKPDVKQNLKQNHILMPTLQWVMRASNAGIDYPDDYLTGRAHPTVFQGGRLRPVEMVKRANALDVDDIPPLVQLEVAEDDPALPGRDYFDMGFGEALGNTPCAIGLIHRRIGYERRLVVSAEKSADVNGKNLTYHWVVLRGDPDRIRIKTAKNGAVAELVVPYHARAPIHEGSELESGRVDIGVFVHNGEHYSAPAFVSFKTLNNEMRTYDDRGRMIEIDYESFDTRIGYSASGKDLVDRQYDIGNWPKLLDILSMKPLTLPAKILLRPLTPKERGKLVAFAREQVGDGGANQIDATELSKALVKRIKDADASPKELIEEALNGAKNYAEWYVKEHEIIRKLADSEAQLAAIDKGVGELKALGIFKEQSGGKLALGSANTQPGSVEQRMTRFETEKLRAFHLMLLRELVFPGIVNCKPTRNFEDPRLTLSKPWRDLYHYDAKGEFKGWTRYRENKTEEFTADGYLITKRDADGTPIRGRKVEYVLEMVARDPHNNQTEAAHVQISTNGCTIFGPDGRLLLDRQTDGMGVKPAHIQVFVPRGEDGGVPSEVGSSRYVIDVNEIDETGRQLGWTRYHDGETMEFKRVGETNVFVAKDADGNEIREEESNVLYMLTGAPERLLVDVLPEEVPLPAGGGR